MKLTIFFTRFSGFTVFYLLKSLLPKSPPTLSKCSVAAFHVCTLSESDDEDPERRILPESVNQKNEPVPFFFSACFRASSTSSRLRPRQERTAGRTKKSTLSYPAYLSPPHWIKHLLYGLTNRTTWIDNLQFAL